MIKYVTRSELINLGKEDHTNNLRRMRKAEARSAKHNTFLSHSSKDDEVMPAVTLILENHGATVYLDKRDDDIATKKPKDIAVHLRKTISDVKKFVLFASDNIKDSKWVPWELGLADRARNSDNICIFPAPNKSTETNWLEQEYIGIYDRIIWGNFTNKETEWLVWNYDSNTAVRLRDWLTR